MMVTMLRERMALLVWVVALGACTLPTLTIADSGDATDHVAPVDAAIADVAMDGPNDAADAADAMPDADAMQVDTGCPDSACACADLQTDPANCGQCGRNCPVAPHTTPVCMAGACDSRCAGTFADCDRNLGNGCEVDLGSALTDCGVCGRVCGGTAPTNSVVACLSGVCGFACNLGTGDCDADIANGCEPLTTTTNCGACGNTCPNVPNSVPICTRIRECGFTCVSSAFANCDGVAANGCEAFLAGDRFNCGACGVSCGRGFCCGGACNFLPC